MLRKDAGFSRAIDGTPDEFRVAARPARADDVPGHFLGGIRLGELHLPSLTDPNAHRRSAAKREAMMEFVARIDSSYYYGGADLFLGTLAGSRPKSSAETSTGPRVHFEEALRTQPGGSSS